MIKKLILSGLLALSTSIGAYTYNELLDNRDYTLVTLGALYYYEENCAGVSTIGALFIQKAAEVHGLTIKIIGEESFMLGWNEAKKLPCNEIYAQFDGLGVREFLHEGSV